MVPQELVDLARATFEAYRDAVGGVNFAGAPIPDWDDLGDTVQKGWIAAARYAYAEGYRDADSEHEPRFLIS